jgi:hypothetical protein
VLAQSILPMQAFALNDTFGEAAPVTAASASFSGMVVGNSGGAFRYYAIDYPGGGLPMPMTMQAQPGRGTGGVATGFKVYGPTGFVGEAIGDDRSTTNSTYAMTLAHMVAGRYVIQVYNFIEGMPLNFQMRVDGIPAVPTPIPPPTVAAEPAPAAESTGDTPPVIAPPNAAPTTAPPTPVRDNTNASGAIVITQTNLTTGGILPGKRDGSFNYYELDYPGGRSPMAITIGYSPTTSTSDKAVGFKVYRRDSTVKEGAVIAGESAENGRNESSATAGFTLNADAAERYLLQVYNYLDNITVNYTLIVSGLAGPVAEVGDISSSARAHVLSRDQMAARGAFSGDVSGRFHYYLVQYTGENRDVRITVTAEPNARIGDGMFGFNLYRDADTAGLARAGLDDKGRRTATLTIKEGDPRTFGIQIYNYSPGAEVRYAITVIGL